MLTCALCSHATPWNTPVRLSLVQTVHETVVWKAVPSSLGFTRQGHVLRRRINFWNFENVWIMAFFLENWCPSYFFMIIGSVWGSRYLVVAPRGGAEFSLRRGELAHRETKVKRVALHLVSLLKSCAAFRCADFCRAQWVALKWGHSDRPRAKACSSSGTAVSLSLSLSLWEVKVECFTSSGN